jgi:hypothetical protein
MKLTFLSQNKAKKEDETKWYYSYVDQNIPYVIIRKRSDFADVEWDCITMNPADAEFVYTQKDFIAHELTEFIKYYELPKTIMHPGLLSGYAYNLPVETVESFVTDVCNTLSEAYKRHNL